MCEMEHAQCACSLKWPATGLGSGVGSEGGVVLNLVGAAVVNKLFLMAF